MNAISACLVVRNEEKIIERCLKSIANCVDEIIFIHDGECSDNTIAIAKKYHAKITIHPQSGEIEKLRVIALQQATYNWILQIDADEYLSKPSQKVLRTLIEDSTADAYTFKWPIYDGKRYIDIKRMYDTKTILLRKNTMYFLGMIHEAPKSHGHTKKRLDLVLHHKPLYNNYTFERLIHKRFRWGRIQAKEIMQLETLPRFQIQDADAIITHYKKIRARPMRTIIGGYIVKDILRSIRKEHLMQKPPIAVKIKLYNYINYLYLAYYLLKLKHNEKNIH